MAHLVNLTGSEEACLKSIKIMYANVIHDKKLFNSLGGIPGLNRCYLPFAIEKRYTEILDWLLEEGYVELEEIVIKSCARGYTDLVEIYSKKITYEGTRYLLDSFIQALVHDHIHVLDWLHETYPNVDLEYMFAHNPDHDIISTQALSWLLETYPDIDRNNVLCGNCRSIPVMEWLIDNYNIDVHAYRPVLITILESSLIDNAKWFVEKYPDVYEQGYLDDALMTAFVFGDMDTIKWTMHTFPNATIVHNYREVFREMCAFRDADVLMMLVDRFPDIYNTQQDIDAVFNSICYRKPDVAKWLLDNYTVTCDVYGDDYEIFKLACHRNMACAKWLLETYPDFLNANVDSAVVKALCGNTTEEEMVWLLSKFPDVNMQLVHDHDFEMMHQITINPDIVDIALECTQNTSTVFHITNNHILYCLRKLAPVHDVDKYVQFYDVYYMSCDPDDNVQIEAHILDQFNKMRTKSARF